MFLRDKMEHNKFDYSADIIKPLKYFLRLHNITSSSDLTKRKVGYFDKRAYKNSIITGNYNLSQYFNNFDKQYIPKVPELDDRKNYVK